jgi:catechol 2,3-dioxygenase-like lactoylglutathione lyase family enzyme
MFLGLRTLIYRVPDLAAAKSWYETVVGHPAYFDEPFYVGFNVAGYELGLVPLEGQEPGATTFWGVPDAETAFATLVGKGAVPREAVHDVGGGIKVGTLFDPSGNILGIIENPHFQLPSPAPDSSRSQASTPSPGTP